MKCILSLVGHISSAPWPTMLYTMTSSNGNIFHDTALALCAGNSPVTGEFPSQRPVTRRFDVIFDLRLKKPWVTNRAHYDVIVVKLQMLNGVAILYSPHTYMNIDIIVLRLVIASWNYIFKDLHEYHGPNRYIFIIFFISYCSGPLYFCAICFVPSGHNSCFFVCFVLLCFVLAAGNWGRQHDFMQCICRRHARNMRLIWISALLYDCTSVYIYS